MIYDGIPRGVPGDDDPEKQKLPLSQWANPEAVRQNHDLIWNDGKVFFGLFENKIIGIGDDRHVTTVAGSRAGKGVSCIVPNLFLYKGSVIAIDPKGELASMTARRRARDFGQKVCILDPFDRTAPHVAAYKAAFNPLTILNANNPYVIEDAGLIADALVVPATGANVDPHWDDSAKNFIEAVTLYVCFCDKFKDRINLSTVYELLTKGMEYTMSNGEVFTGVGGLCLHMVDDAGKIGHEDVALTVEGGARTMFNRGENEKGSVVSTINRHTRFLGYQSIRKVVAKNDFDLSELKTNQWGMTIYLCLPAGRMATCNRWLRMMINLALERMERLGQRKAANGRPVMFVLDEFAVLGHMQQIEVAAGQIASFGVKLWFILQDLTQLKSLYRDRWETFLGNSGVLQFFGNNDLTTLEFLQKRLGKTALLIERQNPKAGMTMGVDKSFGYEMHDLITADEAARIFSRDDRQRRQLVLWAGRKPMILERAVYYDKSAPYHHLFQGADDDA